MTQAVTRLQDHRRVEDLVDRVIPVPAEVDPARVKPSLVQVGSVFNSMAVHMR